MEESRLQGFSQIGFQVRGGVPLNSTCLGYALYVANGPRLRSNGENAGTLDFENAIDINNNKAVGGHIEFWPIGGLELGYGFEIANTESPGGAFHDVEVLTKEEQAIVEFLKSVN